VTLHFVIDAHAGGESRGVALQLDLENADGMRAQSFFKRFAADRQCMPVDRLVGLRLGPALHRLAHVELGEPDAFSAQGRSGEQTEDQTLQPDNQGKKSDFW